MAQPHYLRFRCAASALLPGIPQIDWAGRTEGRGNAGQTANSFFHPSGPSGFSHLIPPKSLIKLPKLTRGAGRTPFHPGNPGPYVHNMRPDFHKEVKNPDLPGSRGADWASLPRIAG